MIAAARDFRVFDSRCGVRRACGANAAVRFLLPSDLWNFDRGRDRCGRGGWQNWVSPPSDRAARPGLLWLVALVPVSDGLCCGLRFPLEETTKASLRRACCPPDCHAVQRVQRSMSTGRPPLVRLVRARSDTGFRRNRPACLRSLRHWRIVPVVARRGRLCPGDAACAGRARAAIRSAVLEALRCLPGRSYRLAVSRLGIDGCSGVGVVLWSWRSCRSFANSLVSTPARHRQSGFSSVAAGSRPRLDVARAQAASSRLRRPDRPTARLCRREFDSPAARLIARARTVIRAHRLRCWRAYRCDLVRAGR